MAEWTQSTIGEILEQANRPAPAQAHSKTSKAAAEQIEKKRKGKPGFHVISLAGSKKLQRLHTVLLEAKKQGRKMSSLELTMATKLVALSTWCSHLRANGIPLANETRQENGETIWYYWIP